ncbi:MAG: hypothetical protein GEU98_20530 [Pseudonocardiaceae bacterium]|nr:hypothetical protein [Pseudonocardiaceae bacterium]
MVLPRPLTLSAFGLERIVRRHNIGTLHVTLAPEAVWIPDQSRQAVEQRVTEQFIQLGLLDAQGRLDPELADSLAVLCHPVEERYGWISRDGNTRAVLAGAIGREALLAIRDGDEVWVNQIDPERLEQVLVAQLPEVTKASGNVINVVHADLVAARGGRAGDVKEQRPSYEIRRLQQIVELPATGGAELYAGYRDSNGRNRHTEQPLRVADTSEGRWENVTTQRQGGDTMITVAPANASDIANRLRQLRQTL